MKDATGTEIKKYDFVCRAVRSGNRSKMRFGLVKEVSENSVRVATCSYSVTGRVTYSSPSTWRGHMHIMTHPPYLPKSVFDAAMACPEVE